jgi:protein phosphatase
MTIQLPDPSLLLLIGPSGSGKSTLARRHFQPTEILSSDFCRALICDNENDQTATNDAFELLHLILARRLARKRTTVIDATNVQASSRASLLAASAQWNVPAFAIVFQLPEEVCQRRNSQRTHRQVPCDVITKQIADLAESGVQLESEGFAHIHRVVTDVEAENMLIVRQYAGVSVFE